MRTLLECLYNLLTHITEDHAKELPYPLRGPLNDVTTFLGEWLESN